MTATAQLKTEPRSTAGRFSFQMCTCPIKVPHAYFHLSDGDSAGNPITSKVRARESLERFVTNGQIPADQKSVIEEDINLSTLPELEDHQGEAAQQDDLLEMILRIINQVETAPAGTYDMVIADGRATLFVNGEERGQRRFNTKSTAKKTVGEGVELGYIGKEDEMKMMKQIEESTLPE